MPISVRRVTADCQRETARTQTRARRRHQGAVIRLSKDDRRQLFAATGARASRDG
jgi:hypothetical protein